MTSPEVREPVRNFGGGVTIFTLSYSLNKHCVHVNWYGTNCGPQYKKSKMGEKLQNSQKKNWERAIFIFSLGLNLCPPDCQGPRCLWRKFQRRVSSQIWRFKKEERTSLQKSFFAKLENDFLHIRTLWTKPLCCNFHLHHTFPPAQKIELAILYCCCCSGKLSNCCNLT